MSSAIVKSVPDLIRARMSAFVKALPGGNERAIARFTQAAIGIAASPGMQDCVPDTVAKAIYECARLNLIPDPVMREVFLVPFKSNKHGGRKIATLIIGYPGVIKLARNAEPRLNIRTGCVYEADDFTYEDGLQQVFKIQKTWWQKGKSEKDRGKLVFAYCIHKMPGQDAQVKVVPHADLMKLANASRAGFKAGTPWYDHFDGMGEKTAILRSKKTWTLNPDRMESRLFNEAVSMDEADPDSGNAYLDTDDVFGEGFVGEGERGESAPAPEPGERPVGQASGAQKTTVQAAPPAEAVKTTPAPAPQKPAEGTSPAPTAPKAGGKGTGTPAKPKTAQNGDPNEASRGAAVDQSKKELGALLDARLEEVGAVVANANQWKLMMAAIGIEAEALGAKVKVATLAELTDWKMKISAMKPDDIKAIDGLDFPQVESDQDQTTDEGGDGSAEDAATDADAGGDDDQTTDVTEDTTGENVTTVQVVEAWAGIRDISEAKAGAALKKLCKLRYEGKTVEQLPAADRLKLMQQIGGGDLKFGLFE